MKDVSNVRIFERTIWSTFEAEGHLSTCTLRILRGDLPAKRPRFDIRAGPHCCGSGQFEILDSDLQQD